MGKKGELRMAVGDGKGLGIEDRTSGVLEVKNAIIRLSLKSGSKL